MSGEAASLGERAADFRRAFDGAFAEPVRSKTVEREDLLAIRLSGDPYAIRLSHVAKLVADRAVTPVPGPLAELLGIASDRGALVPVYDLRLLLGHPAQDLTPRWLVIAAGPVPIGLAFDGFDSHLRVRRQTIAARPDGGTSTPLLREAVEADGITRTLIDVPAVLDSIGARARRAVIQMER